MNTPAMPMLISSIAGSTCVPVRRVLADLGQQQHADDRQRQPGEHQRLRPDPRQQLGDDPGRDDDAEAERQEREPGLAAGCSRG